MTPPEDDVAPAKPAPLSSSTVVPLHVAKTRSPETDESPPASTTSLTSTPRTSTAFSERLSRSVSPHGRLSMSVSRMGRSSIASPSPLSSHIDTYNDTRSLIVRSFSPAVAIYASTDTEELARGKGFQNGFRELVRPFGETVVGKVVVRDSIGSSRAWDDFGVRFTNLGPDTTPKLEELLERYVEMSSEGPEGDTGNGEGLRADESSLQTSPFHRLFLDRLLSASSLSSHETFLHPVACVIAISSRNQAPIETLRQLYSQTAQDSKVSPSFVNPEYLRYYVLVHDEDRDDASKSRALFEQMKRHFGIHCHLLRLRSEECLPTDQDSVEAQACEWLSPAEDLARLDEMDKLVDMDLHLPHLFESDVTALKSFVRELVAQSVVPHMENKVALWNDQIASRRRGISGRFMSISKKWTGFSAVASRNASSQNGGGAGTSGNYDSLQGFYRYDTPEALLRKLADYAFLLRDYKLAASTYELVRADYGNDKAWKYHAGANEMCAISNLLNPMATAAKTRVDGFDQMMETASYSYLTRCSDAQNALRCIALGVELLKVRGRTAAEAAAKWAIRILELGLVGTVGHILVSERVASCFAAQVGSGGGGLGARKRKAAFWSIMAADEWLKLGKAELAIQRLEDANTFYGAVLSSEGTPRFKEMSVFLEQLHLAARMKAGAARSRGVSNVSKGAFERSDELIEQITEETSEQLGAPSHRRSMLVPGHSTDAGPLSPVRLSRPDPFTREDDDFE
jgi:trafficking protein particle complex subunit 8